jgi:hypothetical protein
LQGVLGRDSHHFAVFAGAQCVMSACSQASLAPPAETPPAYTGRRLLCEADAIDIWIARWLGIRRKHLLQRYGCDPRRLYEIWEESRFSGSRDKARQLFAERHPTLVDRIDYGPHRRVPRRPPTDLQPDLFADLEAA